MNTDLKHAISCEDDLTYRCLLIQRMTIQTLR